jgi:hypothetical protein
MWRKKNGLQAQKLHWKIRHHIEQTFDAGIGVDFDDHHAIGYEENNVILAEAHESASEN